MYTIKKMCRVQKTVKTNLILLTFLARIYYKNILIFLAIILQGAILKGFPRIKP